MIPLAMTGATISVPLVLGFLTIWFYTASQGPASPMQAKHTYECPLLTRGGLCTCGALDPKEGSKK